MTITSTDTPPQDMDVAMTVDVQISRLVLDAASARLALVQEQERRRYGKTNTNLSTLAEEILLDWQPGQTKPVDQGPKVECPHCGARVFTYNTGKLRVHGKPGQRCPVAYAEGQRRTRDARPLRFPMNRAEYSQIRDAIRASKQTVANVITQRLAFFAREGHL